MARQCPLYSSFGRFDGPLASSSSSDSPLTSDFGRYPVAHGAAVVGQFVCLCQLTIKLSARWRSCLSEARMSHEPRNIWIPIRSPDRSWHSLTRSLGPLDRFRTVSAYSLSRTTGRCVRPTLRPVYATRDFAVKRSLIRVVVVRRCVRHDFDQFLISLRIDESEIERSSASSSGDRPFERTVSLV